MHAFARTLPVTLALALLVGRRWLRIPYFSVPPLGQIFKITLSDSVPKSG